MHQDIQSSESKYPYIFFGVALETILTFLVTFVAMKAIASLTYNRARIMTFGLIHSENNKIVLNDK